MSVVDELVNGQQFDSGDPQVGQVTRNRGVGQARVGAPKVLGDVGVAVGQALDVCLVDDRLVQRDARRRVRSPAELPVGDDALRHERRRIGIVGFVGFLEAVPEHLLTPDDLPVDGGGVRVQEQFGPVAPQPIRGRPGPLHPEPVALSRPGPGHQAVPDVGRTCR